MTDSALIRTLTETILDGDPEASVEAAHAALDAGLDPLQILNEGLVAGANEVGKLFEQGEFFLPELMLSGRALKAAMEVVRPVLVEKYTGRDEALQGKVVIATIQTDIHDIGKNLVVSMLTAAGFDVNDLGVDVPVKTIIDKAEESGAQVIALSALLTTSMPFMRDLIETLKARGLREKYLVIVGGAPVTESWAQSIGADGTARNAADCVHLVRRMLDLRKGQTA